MHFILPPVYPCIHVCVCKYINNLHGTDFLSPVVLLISFTVFYFIKNNKFGHEPIYIFIERDICRYIYIGAINCPYMKVINF